MAATAGGFRKRALSVALTLVLCSFGLVAAVGSPAGAATTTVIVGPGDVAPGGSWTSPSGSDTGTVGFVVGPATPPFGSGSLAMSVASTSEHRSFYDYEYGTCASSPTCAGPGTALSTVTALGYSTYRDASSTQANAVPTLNVEIDPDSTTTSGVNYATLVWEPVSNGHTVSNDTWQTWNAYNSGAGIWYSSTNLTGYGVFECPAFSCTATWSQIISNLPNAIIKYGLGPNAGSNWSGFTGNVDGLTVGIGSATKVFDFESPPRITIGDTSIYEGNAGKRAARVMISLDQKAPPGGVSARWTTHPGTATSADFKAKSNAVYFKAGQTTRWTSILVNADTATEGDEQFTVTLGSVEGATVADGTGTVTILDEEGGSANALSIGSSTVTEGHSGGSRYVFVPVTMSGTVTSTVTVHYATGGGSASSPSDYFGRTGTLVFPPKAKARWVLVYLAADQVAEGDETFTVTLSSPFGATIANGTGTVTVVDDD